MLNSPAIYKRKESNFRGMLEKINIYFISAFLSWPPRNYLATPWGGPDAQIGNHWATIMWTKRRSIYIQKLLHRQFDPTEWFRLVPSELAGLYLKWWGEAHWALGWKWSVWHHRRRVCHHVCALEKESDTSQRESVCVKRMCSCMCRLHRSHRSTCAREWSSQQYTAYAHLCVCWHMCLCTRIWLDVCVRECPEHLLCAPL